MAEKELRELRSQFLMMLTHELKQPLTPILGYAGLLESEIKDEELKQYLNRIISNSFKMKEMINKVLNLMKLEAGELKIKQEVINVKEIIEDSIKDKESMIKLKNIRLHKRFENINTKGDYERLKDVIINLLDNAIKFSKPNSIIEIELQKKLFDINIIIKDYGVGIKKQDLSKIFETFYQSQEGRRIEGFGMGLSMCKSIIEQHNGKIKVKSTYTKGSEFIITIPKK